MINKTKPDPNPLKSHLGYHLRVVSNAVSQSFAKKLASKKVTVAEWVILREMYSNDKKTSPSDVAQLTGLTRGAVSKLIERLLNKGLVTRTEVSEDRRYQELKLTPIALKLVPLLASIADQNDQHFFSSITKAEQKYLMDMLIKLAGIHKLNTNPIK